MEHLFVYGTLAKGRANEHKLSDIKGTWEEAYVMGSLFQEGWGSQMGYPGIKLEDEDNQVEGFIFSSNEFDKKWIELDNFEGKEYQRVLTKAYLKSGKTLNVYIYALN